MKKHSIKISIFYCTNSLTPAEMDQCTANNEDAEVNFLNLPCSGKVNMLYLLKAIETGHDALILITCPLGECKFIQGNIRAQKRIEAVQDLLEEAGFGRECCRYIRAEGKNKLEIVMDEIKSLINYLKEKSETGKEILIL